MRKIPFFSRYPFLITLDDYLKNLFSTPPSLQQLIEIREYRELGIKRAIKALRNEGYVAGKDELKEVIAFHLAIFFTRLADPWALRKFADYESKRGFSQLIAETEDVIASVARKLKLKLNPLITESNRCGYRVVLGKEVRSGVELVECYPFSVSVPTYLRLTGKLSGDPKWKLVNRVVKSGQVFISKKDAARLLEEVIKQTIISYGERVGREYIESKYLPECINKVRSVVREVRGFTSDEEKEIPAEVKGKIIESLFPPCIRSIEETLLRGEHLSHHQRFALATFLLNIGASVDYVLGLFKHSPDYNERIARYQIEHLAGMRGSRKKYFVYSCEKMKTLGLCVAECGTLNPVQYYVAGLKKFRLNKKQFSRIHSSKSL